MEPLRILALDQADRTGWAVFADDQHFTGSWHVSARLSPGGRLLETMRNLVGLYERFDVEAVAYEIPVYRGKRERPAVLRHLHHIEGTVLLFCANKKLPEPVGFEPDEWRRLVLGRDYLRAPKGLPDAKRKRWHEDNARWFCRSLGLNIEDGNEAEAVGILEAFRAQLRFDKKIA